MTSPHPLHQSPLFPDLVRPGTFGKISDIKNETQLYPFTSSQNSCSQCSRLHVKIVLVRSKKKLLGDFLQFPFPPSLWSILCDVRRTVLCYHQVCYHHATFTVLPHSKRCINVRFGSLKYHFFCVNIYTLFITSVPTDVL